MSKIVVVGDHDMALGFSLIGLRDCRLASQATVESELEKCFSEGDAGLIILLEDFMNAISPKMKKRIETTTKPVVVTIPGKKGSEQQAGNLQAMIKKAIGIELKG